MSAAPPSPAVRDWSELRKYDRSQPSEGVAESLGKSLLTYLITTPSEIPVFDSTTPLTAHQDVIMTEAELFHFYQVSPEARMSHMRRCPHDMYK